MLDIEDSLQLQQYLLENGLVSSDEELSLRPLKGGVSCVTVLVGRQEHPNFVIKQALPRLRVQSRWLSNPGRAHREAQGIHYLRRLLPENTVPDLLFEDSVNHILAMQAVDPPHDNWKLLLLAGTLIEDHARQFGTLLGSIHTGALGLRDEIEPVFGDYSFFESLRLEPYYEFTASQVPQAAPFIDELLRETRGQRISLAHGDYSPKNVLVKNGKLILLDHETIHWGDPMFDIGFSLTHFLSKANHDPENRSGFKQLADVYWQSYRNRSEEILGDYNCEPRAVKHTLACLLARVHGRSPLEYLTPREQVFQREYVLDIMQQAPDNIPELIDIFVGSL